MQDTDKCLANINRYKQGKIMTNTNNVVYGCFVGEGGCYLPDYNSQIRPYPPIEGQEGVIAIGWGRVGDMRLYESNYKGFADVQFPKVYPNGQSVQAGVIWRFAFEAKIGDFVICPSAATNFLLIGKITSDYLSDHDGDFGFSPYRHLRKVEWLYIIPKNDTRYSQLNQIGMLTFSKSRFSIDEVKTICETK